MLASDWLKMEIVHLLPHFQSLNASSSIILYLFKLLTNYKTFMFGFNIDFTFRLMSFNTLCERGFLKDPPGTKLG